MSHASVAGRGSVLEGRSGEVARYLPLVRRIALRVGRNLPPNVQLDDLVAAGCMGLLDALRRSDAERDEKFEYYAGVRIRGAILDELRSLDWLSRRERAAARADAAQGGGNPAVVVGLDDLESAWVPEGAQAASPLDLAEQRSEREAIAAAVSRLPEREATVVSMHYYQGHAFKEIAVALQVSEPRVSQLHARAVERLRAMMTAPQTRCA
jgi:RNA polymerase sigma factor for flagellar operon FliA